MLQQCVFFTNDTAGPTDSIMRQRRLHLYVRSMPESRPAHDHDQPSFWAARPLARSSHKNPMAKKLISYWLKGRIASFCPSQYKMYGGSRVLTTERERAGERLGIGIVAGARERAGQRAPHAERKHITWELGPWGSHQYWLGANGLCRLVAWFRSSGQGEGQQLRGACCAPSDGPVQSPPHHRIVHRWTDDPLT